MPADQEQSNQSQQLLEEVQALSVRRLVNSVERVDGLSPAEEDQLERGGNFALRAAKRKIVRWLCYGGFAAVALVGATGVGLILGVGILYMQELTGSPDGVKSAMSAIVQFLFGVFATVAFDHVLKRIKKGE